MRIETFFGIDKVYKICRRVVAILLIGIVMSTTILQVCASDDYYGADKMEHTQLDFSEIEYEGYDTTALEELITQYLSDCDTEGKESEVIDEYDEIMVQFDILTTQHGLNKLRYYLDVNNAEYEKIDSDFTDIISDIFDKSIQAIRYSLKESMYADALKAHIDNPEVVESFIEYEDMTSRQKEIAKLETQLEQEYNKAIGAEYEVEVDGTLWTMELLNEKAAAGEIDNTEAYNIYVELTKSKNSVCTDIYIQLVNLRNEEARIYGYDNYAEYAYEEVYSRDYTTEDIKSVYGEVKKSIVPVKAKADMLTAYFPIDSDLYDMNYLTGEKIVDALEPCVGKIHPELNEAFDYMKEHHTYDLEISDKKMPIGYTDVFYQYGMPIIFNKSNGYFYDIETLIHEFGHYNEAYHNASHVLLDKNNVDVAEIHSQGMELLFLKYADRVYGRGNGDEIRYQIIDYMIAGIIDGCLYDEFQNKVYSYEGELTPYIINCMFRELAQEYGYSYGTDTDEAYGWVDVTHTFQSPMYYIGYATSALSAFDIFCMSMENEDLAVDCYMNLTSYGLDSSYCELIDEVGLQNIFEAGTVSGIAKEISGYLDTLQTRQTRKILIWAGIFVVLFLAIVILIVVLIVRHVQKKRREAEALLQAQMAALGGDDSAYGQPSVGINSACDEEYQTPEEILMEYVDETGEKFDGEPEILVNDLETKE